MAFLVVFSLLINDFFWMVTLGSLRFNFLIPAYCSQWPEARDVPNGPAADTEL